MIEEDQIISVELCRMDELTNEQQERYILPGLIDIHFHGAAGYDFCSASEDDLEKMAGYEITHGITSFCPAAMTLPEEQLLTICGRAVNARKTSWKAAFRGLYLEGPFLNPNKCGAQNPSHIRKPDNMLLERLQKAANGQISMVAIAPETEGAIDLIRQSAGKGRFSIAHTCADYEQAIRAMQAGVRHVTHLYNAMPPFSHREPGVVGAAADTEDVMVELICDGYHVHPSVVRSTFRLFGAGRMVLISDSMMAAGLSDGAYMLGDLEVFVKGREARLSDGTIAGSVTNLYDCMKNAVNMGVSKEMAIRAVTYNAAKAVGIEADYGTLGTGKTADILIADMNLNLKAVMKSGNWVKNME